MSATFWPPFAPTTVTRNPDVLITLPDPPRPPGAPIVRPGVARHAGVTLVMIDVVPSAGSFALLAPVTGTVRNVEMPAGGPGSITQLIELSPLPFAAAHTFRKLPAGVPTFYLGYDRPPADPADDDVLGASEPLATVTSHAYLGVCFGDRTSLAPWSWIDTLARAMIDADEATADVSAWAALGTLYAGASHVRVLDHAGRPANGRIMDVRITPAGGATEGPFALTLPAAPADADLEVAAGATSLPLSRGAQSTLFAAVGDAIEIRWRGDPAPGDGALPVHAVYETGDSAKPEEFLALPAGLTSMHVMATDVSRWFAQRPANPGTSTLPRWVGDSRVEPFSDGIRVFRRLADDLIHATGAGNGAHLSAYIVRDFPISPGAADDLGNEVDTSIVALMQRIVDSQGGMRVLGNRFVSLKTSPNDDAKEFAMAAVILGTELTIFADIFGLADTNAVGFFVLLGGAILAYELIPHFLSATDPLVKKLEQSRETIPLLNAIDPGTAVWAPHTATTADNPLAVPMPLGLDDFVERFGAWHQKMQVVKRTRDANGDIFAGYLGGIDINPNRLDAPGHQKAGPYHDVHARVTGPAAALVAATFDERWSFHLTDPLTCAPEEVDDFGHTGLDDVPTSLEPKKAAAFASPAPDDAALPARSARHLVSIGRTYPPGPLPFAPDGERTAYDSIVTAIESARDYIYIEDQYFTPNASEPPGTVNTYTDALIAAAAHCQRLLIIVPAETDQPFGDLRRRKIFAALSAAWDERMLVGSVFRRPTLADPGRIASAGRLRLLDGLDDTQATIVIGPRARVPSQVPYWIWVEGELMLAHTPPTPTTVGDIPAMQLAVLRCTSTAERWGATARFHAAGAAVTLSQLCGIYVHSKTMIVDDAFLSTGSTNINRRGFFYDGEANVFTIPQQLRAAPDNPARALRRALWAEHLGLPDAMGRALLSDPIAAFDLFRRPAFAGNRFRPFSAIDVGAYLSIPTTDAALGQLLRIALLNYVNELVPVIWNDSSDPTTTLDPQPVPGP